MHILFLLGLKSVAIGMSTDSGMSWWFRPFRSVGAGTCLRGGNPERCDESSVVLSGRHRSIVICKGTYLSSNRATGEWRFGCLVAMFLACPW
jgi:hypothetical protein